MIQYVVSVDWQDWEPGYVAEHVVWAESPEDAKDVVLDLDLLATGENIDEGWAEASDILPQGQWTALSVREL